MDRRVYNRIHRTCYLGTLAAHCDIACTDSRLGIRCPKPEVGELDSALVVRPGLTLIPLADEMDRRLAPPLLKPVRLLERERPKVPYGSGERAELEEVEDDAEDARR